MGLASLLGWGKPAAAKPAPAVADKSSTSSRGGSGSGPSAGVLRDGRAPWLLSVESDSELTPSISSAAWRTIEERMAFVPPGEILLDASCDVGGLRAIRTAVPVPAFYMDRYAVSNADFARFVAGGGYEEMDLWPEAAWSSVVRFIDQTGHPGPRFWSQGRPPRGLENHPVVGVCWFEAGAFARWMGKRLPSSSEWEQAGSWAACSDGRAAKSRYPWGSSFDPQRANTWGGGPGTTVPVEEHHAGGTPNGIYQLIGNVWEWTADRYLGPAVREDTHVTFEQEMAEIRGGAYDTYFENQATCQFRTGQPMLYRGRNVGFRCVVRADALRRSE